MVLPFLGFGVCFGAAAKAFFPDDSQALTAYLMGQFTPAFVALCGRNDDYVIIEMMIFSVLSAAAAVATVHAVDDLVAESNFFACQS